MDPEDVSMLWQSITPLEAREVLVQIRLANNPWSGQTEQKEFHQKTMEAAYPFASEKEMTWDDLAAITGNRGKTQ